MLQGALLCFPCSLLTVYFDFQGALFVCFSISIFSDISLEISLGDGVSQGVPKFMSLAALMQDPIVSNLCSHGCEIIKQGFHPVMVSPKRMKSVFSSWACVFSLYYYSVMKNTQKLASEYRDLKESLFWVGAGKKRDFGMGTKIMHFHPDSKCTSGKTGGENFSSWESNSRRII